MKKDGTIYTVIFSLITTFVFVFVLAFVYNSLKGKIEENLEIAEKSSILSALGLDFEAGSLASIDAAYTNIDIRYYQKVVEQGTGENGQGNTSISYKDITSEISSLTEFTVKQTTSVDPTEFEALYFATKDGERIVAKKFSGAGLWGLITGVLTVDAAVTRTIGLEIIAHNETPGLGARITEPEFQEQLNGERIVNNTILVAKPKEGAQSTGIDRNDGQIDAITGATRTSDGMSEIFRKSIAVFQAILEVY